MRSHFFELLYEQCSFHMAEKMPSSVKRRLAADEIEDALVFVGFQPVRGDERGRNRYGIGNGHRGARSCSGSGRDLAVSYAQVRMVDIPGAVKTALKPTLGWTESAHLRWLSAGFEKSR